MGLDFGVTVREVNVRYWYLARKLHPYKQNPEASGMIAEEAVYLFKLVNNVQQFLRENINC